MSGFRNGVTRAIVLGAAMSLAACVSYPDAPRYATRAGPAPVSGAAPAFPQGVDPNYPVQPPAYSEAPPPTPAPYETIEGGALPPPSGGSTDVPPPAYVPPAPTPAPTATVRAGAAYVIQPGDTISGVGRRFQTPVQNLIDLNGLGPRGAITVGQNLILPDNAVDTGRDPYATGPAPVGVVVPRGGVVPPPPPPPSGNAAMPPVPRQPAATVPVASAAAASTNEPFQWPVRGDIIRPFGPIGLGERNNGINIGAPAGANVLAASDGTVGYVGDDLPGQGLTVVILHRDNWRTVYGHLGSATVDDGATVRAGQQIGTVGLTAGDGRPSIHFETRRMQGDDPVAVDPVTVLPR